MEYEGNGNKLTLCTWQDGSALGLRNVAGLKICSKNSDRVARGLRRFVRGKGFPWREIIHHPQNRVNFFELCQGLQVRIGQLHPDI